MKYGFSTLVCPGWQWHDILSAASDLGFDGMEIRGIGKELYLPKSKLFKENSHTNIVSDINRLKLQIPCLATSAYLFDSSLQEAAIQEASDYIELAKKINTPYVRVLADRDPAPGIVDESAVEESLQVLLPKALKSNVTLLLETNGVYADSAKLKKLCDKFSHPALGVVWDVHHPYRFFNEQPELTYANLSHYIKHVHLKDSIMSGNKLEYRMMGYGDVPFKKAITILKESGYEGFLILEWVKRWNTQLEEPGIVLPHFLNTIRTFKD